MTYQISKEALGSLTVEGFAHLVEARIATLREYDAHEAIVRQHALIEDMPEEERYVHLAVPQPVFAEVDSAIRRVGNPDGTSEFSADYEIVGPSFEAKKAALFAKVSQAEGDAIMAIIPQGKLRAYQFREADIRKSDQERYRVALSEAPDASKLVAFEEFSPATRPTTDTRFLEEQSAREDQRQEIMRWAAGLHSDIEDLTPETIDAWEMKPFHG